MATTGTAVELPNVGSLSYNGATFTHLYTSKLNGTIVQDEAKRTTKLVEYLLTVDGYVTLNPGEQTTDASWRALRQRLTVTGAELNYKGNGSGNLIVNSQNINTFQDVAFGPVPKILYFQPLGGSRSALIKWEVTVRIYEQTQAIKNGAVLQWNYEASLTFDDEGYAGLTTRGTVEIPLTRFTNSREVAITVDAFREQYMNIQVDLDNFRVVRRNFNYSRDKRTAEFEFVAEELAPMGLPLGATKARGTMSVRSMKPTGGGKVKVLAGMLWNVSLKATYTIRKDWDARFAGAAFFGLLQFRMNSSVYGVTPRAFDKEAQAQQAKKDAEAIQKRQGRKRRGNNVALPPIEKRKGIADQIWDLCFANAKRNNQEWDILYLAGARAILTDFGFDEGLYLDSKTITFEASWFLATTFSTIMAATGAWTWDITTGAPLWKQTVGDIMGWKSWENSNGAIPRLDPKTDVIVDLGADPFT